MNRSDIADEFKVDINKVNSAFEGEYDADRVRMIASTLAGDLSSYDLCQVAGRMILYDVIRVCGSMENYLIIMSTRLGSTVSDFIAKHSLRLNAEMESFRKWNFVDHNFFSASTLIRGYLMKPTYGEDPWETPCQMYIRVAVQHYYDQGIDRVVQCFHELSQRYYTPASPTLFNAGTKKPQMASCFLIEIEDDLNSILYTGVGDTGMISKCNGGLGININNIRHSMIGDVGMSSGILPAARVIDKTVKYVDQGGKRDGACTVFLRPWHIDVTDFIDATDNFKDHQFRFGTLNTCLWMSRLFFKRVQQNEKWTTFCPAKAITLKGLYGYDFEKEYVRLEALAVKREEEFLDTEKKLLAVKAKIIQDPQIKELYGEYQEVLLERIDARKRRIEHKIVEASELYKSIIDIQIKSGMPYIMHGDSINAKSNQENIGPINSSNLCLEITEATVDGLIASCNLSSMNLTAFARGKVTVGVNDPLFNTQIIEAFDFQLFGQMVRSVVENLDQVIDKNYYPLDNHDGSKITRGKISTLNFRTRPLGIGVSGFADAVYKMDLLYDGPRTIELNKMIFACAYFNALVESIRLSVKNEPYSEFLTGYHSEYQGCKDGVPQYSKVLGSPISSGKLQFDLWAQEAQLLYDMGDLDESIYDRADDIPVPPELWGQNPVLIEVDSNLTICIDPTWESLKSTIKKYGVRHSLLLAIMPTASSSQLFGNFESTEAPQGNLICRQVMSGNFTVINKYLMQDMQEIGCWSTNLVQFISLCRGSVKWVMNYVEDHPDEFPDAFVDGNLKPSTSQRLEYLTSKYKTMYEISQKVPIIHAAQRGRYVCQSQSLNIHLADPTNRKMEAIHSYTNKIGLKTGMYYLRQNPAAFTGNFNINSSIIEYHGTLGIKLPKVKMCIKREGCVSCE